MTTYNDNLTLKDALQLYFSTYHFADGGYHLKWFKIKLGPLYIPFPNTKDRIAAVKIHDVHHIITGYEATLRGEAEIGAWEIASGCGKYYVAWILNFGSFFFGLLFYPGPLFRAFLRGRNSKTNFYYNTVYDQTLLNKTVGELREQTINNPVTKNAIWDRVVFYFHVLFIIGVVLLFSAVLCRVIENVFSF